MDIKIILKMVTFTNKIVSTILLALAYYSLFGVISSTVSFFTTIPVLVIGYLVTEAMYFSGRFYYRPFFALEVPQNDVMIGSDKESKSFHNRYYFEMAFVVLLFSGIIFVSAYFPVILSQFSADYSLDSLRIQFFSTAFYIFLTYTATLISCYLLVINKIGVKKDKITANGIFLFVCTGISLSLFIWNLLQGIIMLL